jgi:hypothetical protein
MCPNGQTVGQNLQEIYVTATFWGEAAIAQLAQRCLNQHQPAHAGLTESQHILKVQIAWDASRLPVPDWVVVQRELNH